jgi:glycosyltransferase involved in cell wall biosynthesis
MKWMDDMMAKAETLEGVTDHGKVSQEEIARHSFRAGIWAYPCPFPEIYCITAIKCQAAGAVPVASNYAALDETIQFGHKQSLGEFNDSDLEKYKVALIWWLQHPEEQEKVRPKMQRWARKKSWKAVAEGWHKDFES